MFIDEVPVTFARFEDDLGYALEQRLVPTYADWVVRIGDGGSSANEVGDLLWMFESVEARFKQRVDADHAAACTLRVCECAEHTWVVGTGILADDQHQVGLFEAGQSHGALSDANGLAQANPG